MKDMAAGTSITMCRMNGNELQDNAMLQVSRRRNSSVCFVASCDACNTLRFRLHVAFAVMCGPTVWAKEGQMYKSRLAVRIL